MKKQCSEFVNLITPYVDQELKPQRLHEVESHLQNCERCASVCASERAIKSLLKERLQVSSAPAHLQRRIRHRLARDEGRPGFWQAVLSLFEIRPVPSFLALTLVLVLILLPSYRLVDTVGFNSVLNLNDVVQDAKLTGEITCLDCELIAKSQAKGKHDATHRLGLRENEHSMWTFLQTDAAQSLLGDSSLLRKKVSIRGTLFMNSRYVDVREYKVL
jgi:mycothiol system anti-sigma-R factor